MAVLTSKVGSHRRPGPQKQMSTIENQCFHLIERTATRCFQDALRSAQDPFKSLQVASKRLPKGPQTPPRTLQQLPRHLQDTPKSSPRALSFLFLLAPSKQTSAEQLRHASWLRTRVRKQVLLRSPIMTVAASMRLAPRDASWELRVLPW